MIADAVSAEIQESFREAPGSIRHLRGATLCQTNLELALTLHRQLCQHDPATLLVAVNAEQVHRAYTLLTGAEFHNPRMVIVPIPGLFADDWALVSPDAMVWVSG